MSGSDDVRRRDNMRHFQGKDATGPMTTRPGDDMSTHDAVPVVPPDPPAADRDELTRAWDEHVYEAYRLGRYGTQEHLPMWHECDPRPNLAETHQAVDALLLSGVLVDAADVRARALEDAADELPLPGRTISRAFLLRWLRDRAVSEREGTT